MSEEAVTYPKVYPTVDVAVFSNSDHLLLCRKPNEELLRFPGGFVDPSDSSYEAAAQRELLEETNIFAIITSSNYVLSTRVPDPRYQGTRDCITTTLFRVFIDVEAVAKASAKDDIAELVWVNPSVTPPEMIMSVHREMYLKLLTAIS